MSIAQEINLSRVVTSALLKVSLSFTLSLSPRWNMTMRVSSSHPVITE